MPDARYTALRIYDLSGRLVRTLVDGEQGAGLHTVVWDGRDSSGKKVAGGVYFYRLSVQTDDGESRSFVTSRRLVVVR